MKNTLAIATVLLLSFFSTSAQEKQNPFREFTIAEVNYVNYAKAKFQKNKHTGDVRFSEINVKFTLPKLLKNKKTVLLSGFEFNNLNPTFSDASTTTPKSRGFFSIAYNIALRNPLGTKGWSYIVGLKPTLASDLEEKISSEDLILQATALFSKRANSNFTYGFGLSFNTRFGKKQIIPIVQLEYKNNNWKTKSYLPAYIKHYYNFKRSQLGISLNVNGNNYNFSNSNSTNLDLDKLSYSRINIGPEYEMYLLKNIKLNIQGGITVGKKLDWKDSNNVSVLDLSPVNKSFFKIGLKLVK